MTVDLSELCQSCGACCATSADWPRFSLESDEALALIPAALVDDSQGKMRCLGDRCAALTGRYWAGRGVVSELSGIQQAPLRSNLQPNGLPPVYSGEDAAPIAAR